MRLFASDVAPRFRHLPALRDLQQPGLDIAGGVGGVVNLEQEGAHAVRGAQRDPGGIGRESRGRHRLGSPDGGDGQGQEQGGGEESGKHGFS